MELNALFGDSDVDVVEEPEIDDLAEDLAEEPADENGIGWKVLALFISGGVVITALVVAFMVWVIEGLVL